MKPIWIIALVLCESLLLLLVGVTIGTITAMLTVWALQNGIDISKFSEGTEMLRAPSLVVPRIVIQDWLLAISLILGLGVLGSFYPAWRAASHPKKPIPAKAHHG